MILITHVFVHNLLQSGCHSKPFVLVIGDAGRTQDTAHFHYCTTAHRCLAAAAIDNIALTAPTRTKNFTNKKDSYCRIYKWRLITILIGLARSVGKCGDSRGRRGAATDLPWCRGAQLTTGVKHKAARRGAARCGAATCSEQTAARLRRAQSV